jgi:hypothetical protein
VTRAWPFFLLGLCLEVAGCDGCGSKPKPTETPSGTSGSGSAQVAPTSSSAWRSTLKARGSAGKIFRAVQSLTLDEEQQLNLVKVGNDLHDAENAARAAEQDAGFVKGELTAAHADIVEGVKAGNVDVAKMAAHEAALAKADEARHHRESEALNRTQRLLDPTQRLAVATAVRGSAKVPARNEDARAPRTPPASARDGGPRKEVNWARTRLESYVSNLGLDSEQEKKVNALLDSHAASDARDEEGPRLTALLDAFEKDGFDANRFPFGDPQDGRGPLFRLGRFLAKVVPILKPEQQSKLAAKLIEPEAVPKRRHPGMAGAHEDPDGDVE